MILRWVGVQFTEAFQRWSEWNVSGHATHGFIVEASYQKYNPTHQIVSMRSLGAQIPVVQNQTCRPLCAYLRGKYCRRTTHTRDSALSTQLSEGGQRLGES